MNNRKLTGGALTRRNALTVALAVGLGFTGVAFGQATTGTIFGSAPSAAGQTVTITGSGVTRSTTVGTNGRYSVSNLPVGSYTVTLSNNGEAVSSHQNVSIAVGTGTEVDFAGTQSATDLGSVQVRANALPSIDVTSVNSSTIITAEQLQKLPLGRNAESIALLSPGAVAGSGYFGNVVSFGGAGVTENAYYVNGYNTGEPYSNTGGFQLPYGSIAQQQTFTGGYSAKYGRSDGGVINQIGKRGTNEWHFGGQISWSPRFLSAGGKSVYYPSNLSAPAGYTLYAPDNQGKLYRYKGGNKSWETIYSAYVGGPLIKDKLYMFLSAEVSQTGGKSLGDVDHPYSTYYKQHSTKYYGKLDWNINDSNVLEMTVLNSQQMGLNDGTASDLGAGAAYHYDYSTMTEGGFYAVNNQPHDNAKFIIGQYTSYISDNATLSITWGKGDFTEDRVYGNRSKDPYTANETSGQNLAYTGGSPIVGNQSNLYVYDPNASNHTKGLRADFTYQLGSHELGVGIDNIDYSAHDQGQHISGPGYAYFYYHVDPNEEVAPGRVGAPGGQGYIIDKYIYDVTTSMSTSQKAYYLQDNWQVTDNLLVNIGLRNDHFTNYNDLHEAYVDEKNQWEPRLGFSWDVFGDSSFKIYGNAGRYYLALPNSVAERAANRSTFTDEYFTYTGIDANGLPTGLKPIANSAGTGPAGPISGDNEYGQPKDARQVSATDLKAQYQDEYILGFDKKLNDDWTYGAKATYRQLKTGIDDVCDPDAMAAKMTKMGLDPSQYDIYDPYCRLFNPGLTNNFLVKKSGTQDYVNVQMSQADWGFKRGAKRKYAAVDLYLEHPFDGKWTARIDYTWSHNFGNNEGQVRSDIGQTDVSKTESWDTASLMENSYGDLPNDRRHSLKVRGSYAFTPEWLVSGTMRVQSGTPKVCLGYYGPNGDQDPAGYRAAYHWCGGMPSHPGDSGTTPWTKQLDLGVRYTPAFADHKLAFKLNVFNVLNEQKAIQTDPNYVQNGRQVHQVSDTYGQGIYFEAPRYVRLSVSYDY